jgi:hypothetical protein
MKFQKRTKASEPVCLSNPGYMSPQDEIRSIIVSKTDDKESTLNRLKTSFDQLLLDEEQDEAKGLAHTLFCKLMKKVFGLSKYH